MRRHDDLAQRFRFPALLDDALDQRLAGDGGLRPPNVARLARAGQHLIQVIERREVAIDVKQLREQARNVLREQKFEGAYLDWSKDLRARAYVEMREPPF